MEKKSIITTERDGQDNYLTFWRRFEKRHPQFPRLPRLTPLDNSCQSTQDSAPADGSAPELSFPGIFGAVARSVAYVSCAAAVVVLTGCGSEKAKANNQDFFTSGDRDADKRASQRMAQSEQLTGGGEGAGEKNVKKASVINTRTAPAGTDGTNKAAQAEGKLALYDRLGGDDGLQKIVADFLPRAMQDPRVNWDRNNVTRGGFRSITTSRSLGQIPPTTSSCCKSISLNFWRWPPAARRTTKARRLRHHTRTCTSPIPNSTPRSAI